MCRTFWVHQVCRFILIALASFFVADEAIAQTAQEWMKKFNAQCLERGEKTFPIGAQAGDRDLVKGELFRRYCGCASVTAIKIFPQYKGKYPHDLIALGAAHERSKDHCFKLAIKEVRTGG